MLQYRVIVVLHHNEPDAEASAANTFSTVADAFSCIDELCMAFEGDECGDHEWLYEIRIVKNGVEIGNLYTVTRHSQPLGLLTT